MSYTEQRQYLKDSAFIQAERDFLNTQDFLEEMERNRKPAKIVIKYEKSELIEEKSEQE